MAATTDPRLAAIRYDDEIVELDAAARNADARAATFAMLRGESERNAQRFEEPHNEAMDAAAEANKKLQALRDERFRNIPRDLSGATMPMTDRTGNFAANLEVATAGGTGIFDSNSTADGSQAESADEAGVTYPSFQPAVIGHGGSALDTAGRPIMQNDEGRTGAAAGTSTGAQQQRVAETARTPSHGNARNPTPAPAGDGKSAANDGKRTK